MAPNPEFFCGKNRSEERQEFPCSRIGRSLPAFGHFQTIVLNPADPCHIFRVDFGLVLCKDKTTQTMYRKHPLSEEFPEFEEKILLLKVENGHFKKLYDEYDELDHHIYRVESDVEPSTDEVANQLRIARLRLKDEIYRFLKEN